MPTSSPVRDLTGFWHIRCAPIFDYLATTLQTSGRMYYDDEVRRFNFLSGLLIGVVLGTGLALAVRPRQHLTKPRRIRNSAERLRRGAREGVSGAKAKADLVRDKVGEAAQKGKSSAKKRVAR